ncbi:hypothetical protein ACS0TY_006449 [Phlomoides rotata]
MAVDPYYKDVLENFSDLPMGTEANDVFIDQVEPSQAWTTWRDNLVNQIMDVNSGMPTVGRGRKKSVPTSRRVWTYGEEKELADPNARGLKNMSFPFYVDWLEIFGNDRATGVNSQSHVDAGDDVINKTTKHKEGSTGGNHSGDMLYVNEFSYVDPASFTVGVSSFDTMENNKVMKRKQFDVLDL